MVLDPVVLLRDLVRIPSVNPMGRDVSGDEYLETRLTSYLDELAGRLDLPKQRQTLSAGRDNLLLRIDGDVPPDRGGKLVLWEVHQDTVPVEGMTIPPWGGELRDDRIWGRGACDVKGGMASMLAAFSRLAAERPRGIATIVLALTVDEEYGGKGARLLPKLWQGSPSTRNLLDRPPDVAIVAEPTGLDVVVAHKGTLRWKCHATGRAAHSSQPQLGRNAVYAMSRAVIAFEQYAAGVGKLGSHRLLGSPTLSVGRIVGGISVNTVPDNCMIEIDRRLLPGEDSSAAFQHAVDHVTAHLPADAPIRHDEPYLANDGLSDELNGELAERLGRVIRRHGGGGQPVGVPYGTDAPAFGAHRIPTVVFGPGSIDQAHTVDEWIAVEQLHAAAEILHDFACDF